ncbi:MAG: hypothetical protein MUO77_03210 [Anaerolineales bacterium]|nr:hypothetical protein [Anaerolineales bacterium]
MKQIVLLSGLLLVIALACSFVSPSQPVCAPCPPAGAPAVVTQIVGTPAQSTLVLEAVGKSSAQLGGEMESYLMRAGWETQGLNGDELVFFAPPTLGLVEPGISYRLRFDTSGMRGLAIVSSQLYFVPQKVGEPFDQTLLFNAIERDFPVLSLYSDMEFNDQYTFRGAYTFDERIDVKDFMNYLDTYAVDVDRLLLAHPFFSKQ